MIPLLFDFLKKRNIHSQEDNKKNIQLEIQIDMCKNIIDLYKNMWIRIELFFIIDTIFLLFKL